MSCWGECLLHNGVLHSIPLVDLSHHALTVFSEQRNYEKSHRRRKFWMSTESIIPSIVVLLVRQVIILQAIQQSLRDRRNKTGQLIP